MASRCHGICSRLPHEKVVRWLSTQLKKLFRFCRRCELYIRHPVDELYCKCCGCKLRIVAHSQRCRKNVKIKQPKMAKKVIQKRWRDKNKQATQSYFNEWYEKNKEIKRAKARLYKLKTKLLKIFFITLYPHLLLTKDVVFN